MFGVTLQEDEVGLLVDVCVKLTLLPTKTDVLLAVKLATGAANTVTVM